MPALEQQQERPPAVIPPRLDSDTGLYVMLHHARTQWMRPSKPWEIG